MTPPPSPTTLPLETALKPLNSELWTQETAAHLLRRIGFSATPDAVIQAHKDGAAKTLKKAFPENMDPFPISEELKQFRRTVVNRYKEIRQSERDGEEKRKLQRELRREEQALFNDFALDWVRYAREPQNSAREKYVLFLQDVFVVQRQKIRMTASLQNLQQTIRNSLDQTYPELCKAISREPAMVKYLDLDKNRNKKPNENFARELFELFTLGEGNYSETDIKEASRAFTGYRVKNRYDFAYDKRQSDPGMKTVFGESGNWKGDDVIDITFRQPAARTFLVREFFRFYVSDTPIDEAYIEAIGEKWANAQFSLRYLVETVFRSNLFYHPAYRGSFVKSPIHFYLGICQDLHLDVVPFEGKLLQSLRAMGQRFYDPPNVRGWLYGQNWINSTTISARRQVVDYLFAPLNEKRLNANDKRALDKARENGQGDFLITNERLLQLADIDASDLATHFTQYFVTEPYRASYRATLESVFRQESKKSDHTKTVRNTIIALLQSPAYNLC